MEGALDTNRKKAIEIKGLGKKYESFNDGESQYVLRDINIDVMENEFVCVLGPSLSLIHI